MALDLTPSCMNETEPAGVGGHIEAIPVVHLVRLVPGFEVAQHGIGHLSWRR